MVGASSIKKKKTESLFQIENGLKLSKMFS